MQFRIVMPRTNDAVYCLTQDNDAVYCLTQDNIDPRFKSSDLLTLSYDLSQTLTEKVARQH